MPLLRVFVERGCHGSARARRLAEELRASFPALQVEVVDLAAPASPVPADVFATPTYVLDGKLLSLGNPRPAVLVRRIAAALATAERQADR